MNCKTRSAFLFVLLLTTLPSLTLLSEYRIWTNSAGKEIHAEYVSSTDTHVKIKLKNRKIFDVKLADLSEADVEYVKTTAILKNPIFGADSKPSYLSLESIEAIFGKYKQGKERAVVPKGRDNDLSVDLDALTYHVFDVTVKKYKCWSSIQFTLDKEIKTEGGKSHLIRSVQLKPTSNTNILQIEESFKTDFKLSKLGEREYNSFGRAGDGTITWQPQDSAITKIEVSIGPDMTETNRRGKREIIETAPIQLRGNKVFTITCRTKNGNK